MGKISELEEMEIKRDSILEHWKDITDSSIEQVCYALTHPPSYNPSDIKAGMWMFSKAIQVDILIKKIEILSEKMKELENILDSYSSSKETDKTSEVIASLSKK